MRRTSLFASITIALTGCYSSGAPTTEPLPPVATADLACAPSELSLAWVRQDGEGTYRPASIDVSPGAALLLVRSQYGAGAVRMRDGEPIGALQSAPLDAAWSRDVAIDPEIRTVRVRELETGVVLRTIGALESREGWYGHTSARLTPDGERAILLDCDREPGTDRSRTTVREVSIATGASRRVELPLACSASASSTDALVLPARDAALVLGLREPGPEWTEEGAVPARIIARVDFASATVSAQVELGEGRAALHGMAHIGDPSAGIVGHALSEDGEELAVVGRDGQLRRFDTRTLEERGAMLAAPIFVANEISFGPSLESPVAFSPARALFAHVDDDGAIVIRDGESGAIAARLETPFDEAEPGRTAPVMMALRFVRDGLIVVGATGVARFTCGGLIEEPARPATELALRVEGPSVMRGDEIARFAVDVEHATGPVVRAVRLGAGGAAFASIGRDVIGYSPGVGTFAVEITADDGVRTARIERTIEVLATE